MPGRGSLGSLPAQVVAFVMLGNTAFGLVFGWLFWRYGLEAAMFAHAIAHAVAFVLALNSASKLRQRPGRSCAHSRRGLRAV